MSPFVVFLVYYGVEIPLSLIMCNYRALRSSKDTENKNKIISYSIVARVMNLNTPGGPTCNTPSHPAICRTRGKRMVKVCNPISNDGE